MSWKFFRDRRDPQYDEIIDRIKAYNKPGERRLVHFRLDNQTIFLLNQIKAATGVNVQMMMAFAVGELMRRHPELKTIVKQFLQKNDI